MFAVRRGEVTTEDVVAFDGVAVGEEHESRRDAVRGHALAGPVAELHRRVRAELLEVEHVAAVEHADAGVLAERVDEAGEVRPGEGRETFVPAGAGGDLREQRADAVAVVGRRDRPEIVQRGEQSRHRALRQPDPLGELGHAGLGRREAPEYRQRALDRLHVAHAVSVPQSGTSPKPPDR